VRLGKSVKPPVLMTIGALWLAGVAAGLTMMADFANRPGPAAVAPSEWPVESRLERDPSGPTLVMFAHPRCDCTRASLTELAELLARSPSRPATIVALMEPHDAGPDWRNTSIWRSAEAIPGVVVVRDVDGLEARRFGAKTSGQALLYDRNARLVFAGGTTGARGHVGPNAAFDSLLTMLSNESSSHRTASVFGCSLAAAEE
jgi:hypothetical protein